MSTKFGTAGNPIKEIEEALATPPSIGGTITGTAGSNPFKDAFSGFNELIDETVGKKHPKLAEFIKKISPLAFMLLITGLGSLSTPQAGMAPQIGGMYPPTGLQMPANNRSGRVIGRTRNGRLLVQTPYGILLGPKIRRRSWV